MPRNEPGAVGFLDGVRDPGGRNSSPVCHGGGERVEDDLGWCAGTCGIVDGNPFGCGVHGPQPVPDGILAFLAAKGHEPWLGWLDMFRRQLGEGVLHAGPDDDHDTVDGGACIEAGPCMGHDGA